jgi:hypothetical protein
VKYSFLFSYELRVAVSVRCQYCLTLDEREVAVGIEEILNSRLLPKRDQHSTVGAPELTDLMRTRVRRTYSICYSANAQTQSGAPNHRSVLARIFASVFARSGPSVFKPSSVKGLFSAGLCQRGDRSFFDNYR